LGVQRPGFSFHHPSTPTTPSSKRLSSPSWNTLSRALSTSVTSKSINEGYAGNGVVGIVRESYNKWERRVPLTPDQVRALIAQSPASSPIKVLVQPANHRIFTDAEYVAAGATLQEDLSEACLILGVKQVKEENLLPDKSYMFFSHVIKGQPENMPLLQKLLDSNIRFFDYECITQGGESDGRRLVAFGEFAGIAGMIDTFQAIGQQLLQSGYSTPFLNSPSSYMYRDLVAAKFGVSSMGRDISNGGLPSSLEPLVFAFTGGGNVARGAREIFELLPHKYVKVSELEELKKVPGPHTCVYGVLVEQEDMVKLKASASSDEKIEKAHYRKNPSEYEPIFHTKVGPYVNVLVNGMYWDQRYPRLLTKDQIKGLYAAGNDGLLALADISCDIGGSVEFLEKSTSVEKPYFNYDPRTDEVTDKIRSEGIAVMGVDILPSELPREASKHFGDALLPLLPEILGANGSAEGGGVGVELTNSCITAHGELMDNFRYIEQLKSSAFKEQSLRSLRSVPEAEERGLVVELDGHLFDSGLINSVLDLMEASACEVEIINMSVRGTEGRSHAVLRVTGDKKEEVVNKVRDLVPLLPTAEATCSIHGGSRQAVVTDMSQKRVLVLGAGRVANSFAEYIGRGDDRKVVVAGNVDSEVRSVAAEAKHGEGVCFDVTSDKARLEGLVKESDVVVSLLPAPFHGMVGDLCINNGVNMVTASYVSPAVRELEQRCLDAGLSILNEVGLDPGMDHMSAMKIMDDVKERGGMIKHFSSVCGGLPAPEAATNPLMYKFSWSPMGVMTASQNSAVYLREGEVVKVEGSELLNSAEDLHAFPTMNLECLPNRDSLIYRDLYDIQEADTVFRGTIRFKGFSQLMYGIKKLGLLEDAPCDSDNWAGVVQGMLAKGGAASVEEFVAKHCPKSDAQSIADCLNWLGMNGADLKVAHPGSAIKSFCALLESRLLFEGDERDMVLMHHDIRAEFPDGTIEKHRSNLQVYGEVAKMSAMCKTVGYTAAIGAEMILRGDIVDKGILTPMDKSIYGKGLELLEEEGLVFDETCEVIKGARAA